ncbi:hypothetical protein GCM10007216_28040 [Thalassobacillus devorans]|uniref:Uncharacterized protein n=1 Tax=Thalassobacillus devorans TaxID=279813 RepID=A0ABQ1PEF9_9BACI|nr:hypothetical protein [Thalassobacillus devorans]NIK29309.1 hypothetical protein [Thalassobacillus devorans]GGC95687.1 hypothetical protein GCM10007216_28040 [Thalassobacillus devorans]
MWAISFTALLIWAGLGIKKLHSTGLWKDLIVYACVWAVAMTIITLYRFHIPVPNPLDGISYIYQPLSKLYQQLFS